MQDIVFYAVASETCGILRDYANVHSPEEPPILTLGVSVCLRMRLFSSAEDATPYPIASFSDIVDWQWSMDSDFDRSTTCKLVADAGGISVHTVADTINGETASFTEFVIPISNMNTEELAAWLGNEKKKSGLTGELVGYDSNGNATFVLQIDDFTVRNRVAGLGDPIALDYEIVTRSQAEQMIQTAVSASAETKQDKLTSSNAGSGISIANTGIISTDNVPQSAISGLSASLAAKQNCITAGYRMALVNGSTVDQARYFNIEPAITAPANQTTTIILSAGKAYEIHATATNAKVLLNREEPPSVRTFGLEGHIELFVAGTGYVVTGSNVVLANALEPDAVNNCTVRFHDGYAIISVEDHVAGYIVTVDASSGAGSLAYGLSTATNEYISVDASLNGQTLDLGGATTNGEKHVVGNGYTETIVSGGINCTSKTTLSNLAANGVVVSSGTLTMGDVYIPNGATVTATAGTLFVEKLVNDGDFDCNGHFNISSGTITGSGTMRLQGARLTGNNYAAYGFTVAGQTIEGYNRTDGNGPLISHPFANCMLSSCTITGFSAYNGAAFFGSGATESTCGEIKDCIFSGNSGDATAAAALNVRFGAMVRVTGGTFDVGQSSYIAGGTCFLGGTLKELSTINGSGGKVFVSYGATLDLTGNTNATPIAPGGSITFASGGAINSGTKIIGSAGSATQTRTFEDVTISGTSISNIGAIYGATISDVPTYGYVLTYTTDGGVTSNTHNLNDTAPTDVPGTFGSSAGVLSVVKSNS